MFAGSRQKAPAGFGLGLVQTPSASLLQPQLFPIPHTHTKTPASHLTPSPGSCHSCQAAFEWPHFGLDSSSQPQLCSLYQGPDTHPLAPCLRDSTWTPYIDLSGSKTLMVCFPLTFLPDEADHSQPIPKHFHSVFNQSQQIQNPDFFFFS